MSLTYASQIDHILSKTTETALLVQRVHDAAPRVEAARKVADALEIKWDREPESAMLAWAWTIWPALDAGRREELTESIKAG